MKNEDKATLIEKTISKIAKRKGHINAPLISKTCAKNGVNESYIRKIMHWV